MKGHYEVKITNKYGQSSSIFFADKIKLTKNMTMKLRSKVHEDLDLQFFDSAIEIKYCQEEERPI